jgi:3-phenylpropionate/trans-cinnamate dioxygenase ferredoxin subunit
MDEISSGAAKRFDVDGHRIAVARVGDTFYAIGDRCSHEDFSLSLGEVDAENCEIECARHGASFALASGEAMTFPATAPVATYAVSLIDGAVVVTIP